MKRIRRREFLRRSAALTLVARFSSQQLQWINSGQKPTTSLLRIILRITSHTTAAAPQLALG